MNVIALLLGSTLISPYIKSSAHFILDMKYSKKLKRSRKVK